MPDVSFHMAGRGGVIPLKMWIIALGLSLAGVPFLLVTNALVIGVGFLAALTLVLSLDERFRLFALVGLLPFSHAGVGLSEFGGFGPFDFYLAWVLLLFLWSVGPLRLFRIHLPRPVWLGALLLLAFAPSLGNARLSIETLKAFLQLLVSVLTAAAVYDIIRRRNDPVFVRRLLVFFVGTATVVSIDGLLTTASAGALISVAVGRAYFSFFQDVNYYAGYLLMALSVAVGLLFLVRGIFRKLLVLGSIGVLTVATIATVSRSAMAVYVLLMGAYVTYFVFQRGMTKWIGALLISGVVGIIGLVVFTNAASRVVDLFTVSRRIETVLSGKDASLEQRSKILGVSLRMIADHPLVGVGFGSFEATFDRYKGTALMTGYKRSAHNTYIRTFAETGVIGITALLVFIGSLVLYCYRMAMAGRGHPLFILFLSVAFSLGTFLMMSATLDQMFEPHFWVIAGAALGFGPMLLQPSESESEPVSHA